MTGLLNIRFVLLVLLVVSGGNQVACQEGPQATDTPSGVERVHVIFMNHLDVGYANFVNNILNEYFHVYFPRAAELGEELRLKGYTETFTYTTHPWVVSMYLDCPPHLILSGIRLLCPSAKDVSVFRDAVERGYITWHAGPMNIQAEYSPEWLLEAGLSMSHHLDHRFNITRRTRVLSQRDIPGMTHASIPTLVKSGVSGVAVGVNEMSSPPAVPKLFRWAYDGDEILATWHPGGYPENPGPDPAHPGGLSRNDCVVTPGCTDVLCFAFRTDNSGPPADVEEILSYYEILRAEFPAAVIRASTLEDYFLRVQSIRSKLPLVTKEIGDTWIGGVASDPRKNAEFRLVARTLGACVQTGRCQATDRRVWNATRLLTKLPEHTWGLWTSADDQHWRNDQFHPIRNHSNFVKCVMSWREQRNFTYLVIDALEDHQVASHIRSEMDKLLPVKPDLRDYTAIFLDQATCGSRDGITLNIGQDGSIIKLLYNGTSWTDQGGAAYMSKFTYISLNQTDFDRFGNLYNYEPNVTTGYEKPNMTPQAHPESRDWPYVVSKAYRHMDKNRCDLWLRLQPENNTTHLYYGGPQSVWIRYHGDFNLSSAAIDIEVLLINKTSTRLPEALYVSFKPSPRPIHTWLLSKSGHKINPLNVILNGSHYQHGVDDGGVSYVDQSGHGLYITSPDVPLVCPITAKMTHPTSFPAPLDPITGEITGMAFNVYNNLWNTNYIFWYPYIDSDKDYKARFRMAFT